MAEQLLKEAGATILQQIHVRQPMFLVEIEPSDLHPETIISQLGKVGRWGCCSEYKAAAAWAAVQLASRSDALDVQDEGGFRRLFFRELGRDFSLNDWQDTFEDLPANARGGAVLPCTIVRGHGEETAAWIS